MLVDPIPVITTKHILFILTLVAALGCGVISGVFFAFSAFVMKALFRLPVNAGIAAMQSINVVVLNPWFFGAFFGTAAACLVVLVWSLVRWPAPGAAYLLVGSVLYLMGTILVTILYNVPRNDALAAIVPDDVFAESRWANYVKTWTAWNHVRTLAAFAASISFVLALSQGSFG